MMLLQIFQNVDKSMNHNKKHVVLLVSQMVKLRQSNQKNEMKKAISKFGNQRNKQLS